MVHQISANGGMQPHFESNPELSSHAIDARHQDGVHVLGLIDREEPAKPSNFTKHAASKSLVCQILDALLGAVGAVNLHACVSVGDGCGSGCRVLGHGLSRCLFLNPSVWESAGFLA